MENKREFHINTAIKVYGEDLITYDTVTDIGLWKPKQEEGVKPEFYDENDILYYYWCHAIVATMGFPDEEADKVVNDLLKVIYHAQGKIVTADYINEKNGNEKLMDGAKAPTPKPGATPVDEYFINVKLTVPEDNSNVRFDVETNITGKGETRQNRTLLYYYWSHAMAECVTFVTSKVLQDYLAKNLINTLMTAGDGMVASIND